MGGNALKQVTTVRLTKENYHRLSVEVSQKMRERFPDRRIEVIPAFRLKADFGDLDILIDAEGLRENLIDVIRELFNPTEIVTGNAISFDVENFQVDIIPCTSANFATSLVYYSYNDLGNLMGRISHKLGFKYGHEGLSFRADDNNYVIFDFVVSRDSRQIFEFLGYDYDRFLQGFDTLLEVFEYAASTKYFNPEMFKYENRNYASRVRDKKRSSYSGFLEWCENPTIKINHYPWAVLHDRGGYVPKTEFVEIAYNTFPGLKERHEKELEDYRLKKLFKEYFSAEDVTRVTGLTFKDLGNLMKYLKSVIVEEYGGQSKFGLFLETLPEDERQPFVDAWIDKKYSILVTTKV